jgi:hypothetical protein
MISTYTGAVNIQPTPYLAMSISSRAATSIRYGLTHGVS